MVDTVSSKTIDGITDLVVWAPIKEGFIDAFENITYETRLHLVAEALHKVRQSAREHELIAPFADTAERILTLLDFRIGVVNRELYESKGVGSDGLEVQPRRYMYLVATFDGPWEPYIRLIWNPLGPFLDLLLCNCEGYITAGDHSFEEYAHWVRNNQLDSSIFYSTTGLTVKDQSYLSKLERCQREKSASRADAEIARMTSDDPVDLALEVRKSKQNAVETNRLALEALTVLYRLADYYPPDRLKPTRDNGDAEGRYLLRVAHDLLHDWPFHPLPDIVEMAYKEPLAWFRLGSQDNTLKPTVPNELDRKEIQKGLLSGYDSPEKIITHGAVLLIQIKNVKKFRKFLDQFPFSWEAHVAHDADGSVFDKVLRNIAFTYRGLERMGLPQEELDKFPVAFREGMEARAPQLGDIGNNHPRRWKLPTRNWPPSQSGSQDSRQDNRPPVDMSEVDVVIQFRSVDLGALQTDDFIPFSNIASSIYNEFVKSGKKLASPFFKNIDQFSDASPIEILIGLIGFYGDDLGLSLLAIEDMHRPNTTNPPEHDYSGQTNANPPVGHFGFRDGLSQPIAVKDPSTQDEVPYGDLIWGYENSLGDQAIKQTQFMTNGSFLAIRKMYQDVETFNKFLAKYEKPEGSNDPSMSTRFEHGELAARLVGRRRGGEPLIHPTKGNEFDYESDKSGEQCPFSAHIRRANPRDEFQGRAAPRILRRGMTYGKPYAKDPDGERGIVFMAYNASISEQFEVIQRWINGANSTNILSSQNDPFIGDTPQSKPRTFRFVMDGKVKRVVIDKPFVRLEWGEYFFVPSRAALRKLSKAPRKARNLPNKNVQNGEEIIRRIKALDPETQRIEWKIVLEDFLAKDPDERASTPDVWQAIVANGGALRIDSGVSMNPQSSCTRPTAVDKQPVVLVADEQLIMDVLSDYKTFSVDEQDARCKESFGQIYVAQDPDRQYYKEAKETNEILFVISEEEAFNDAYASSLAVLGLMKATATKLQAKSLKMELRRQFLRPTLGELCKKWFGIPDEKHILSGSWGWDGLDQGKPLCPGDFMSPSRHAFYPRPTPAISKYGIEHGRGLNKAAKAFVRDGRKKQVEGKISTKMFAKIADNDVLARNLIGIMTGALPPIDGNLRGIFYDWLTTETLWRHQGALHRAAGNKEVNYAIANAALRGPVTSAISKRPAPDIIFRTAKKTKKIGHGSNRVTVNKGDTVILGLVSATQQRIANGTSDNVDVVFGGDRQGPKQPANTAVHACPAYKLAMGAMLGIIAALLDSGKLKALPASLIVEISGWKNS